MFHLYEYLQTLRWGRTIQELSEKFEVSERTMRRYLQDLTSFRFINLTQDVGPDGRVRYKIEREVYIVRSAASEIADFRRKLGSELPDFASEKSLEKNRAKTLRQILGPSFFPKRLLQGLVSKQIPAMLGRLIDAKSLNVACTVRYDTGNKLKRYKILVLEIFRHRKSTYLLARLTSSNAIRILAYNRIRDVELNRDMPAWSLYKLADYTEEHEALLKNFIKRGHKDKASKAKRLAKSLLRLN